MSRFVFTSLILFSWVATSQTQWNETYYDSLDLKNFRKHKPFNQVVDIDKFDHRLANAAVFYVTNEIRDKKKLSILNYHKSLEIAAYLHSADMAKKRFFDHINPSDKKRRTPDDRARLAGIGNPYPAENITEGFVLDYKANVAIYPRGPGKFSYTPNGDLLKTLTYLELAEKLLDAWMNSPPHRENILSKNNIELGCGIFVYQDKNFNNMPMVKATQLFQQYYAITLSNKSDNPF